MLTDSALAYDVTLRNAKTSAPTLPVRPDEAAVCPTILNGSRASPDAIALAALRVTPPSGLTRQPFGRRSQLDSGRPTGVSPEHELVAPRAARRRSSVDSAEWRRVGTRSSRRSPSV